MAFTKIASTSEITEGKLFCHTSKYVCIALTKLQGEYYAFEDVCSHDGEEISSGVLEGDTITCPRHFAQFNIKDGSVLRFPATEPLKVYPIKIEDGSVFVDLEL